MKEYYQSSNNKVDDPREKSLIGSVWKALFVSMSMSGWDYMRASDLHQPWGPKGKLTRH